MVSLFTENEPAANSALQSAVIRENFEALYDKLKTLEVRAESTPSTSILIEGGTVYFRAGISKQLRLISKSPEQFNFTTRIGWKTVRAENGSLERIQQAFPGPSSFEAQGLFLEVLLSLRPDGSYTFTEALTGQNNELSSPFNIYIDDAEIPIALIILRKSTEGVLQAVRQEDIREARPFITTAFQNTTEISELEAQVRDNTDRVQATESSLQVTSSLLVRLPPRGKLIADNTTTTNTLIEVVSGQAFEQSTGRFLKFAGGYVDFSASAIVGDRLIPANTPLPGGGHWNKALISLKYDAAAGNGESSSLTVTHGTSNADREYVIPPTAGVGEIPLGIILYRINSNNTDVIPIIDLTSIGDTRIAYEFPIVEFAEAPLSDPLDPAFSEVQVDFSGSGLSPYDVENDYFLSANPIEIFDGNTRTIRRTISTTLYDINTAIATITLTSSFTEISLARSPQVRSVNSHQNIIEDVRPFIGIN